MGDIRLIITEGQLIKYLLALFLPASQQCLANNLPIPFHLSLGASLICSMTESIAVYIWEDLHPAGALHKVKVQETDCNAVEYKRKGTAPRCNRL